MAQLQLDDGTSIAYDDHRPGNPGTTGLPLLLVHGHPFDRSMWRPQAEHFARRGHRVVVPDLRGYGGSSGPAVTSLAGFSRDLIALADQLGLAEFVLGGLSMGGQIVMQTVRDHPGRVSALLLADTFPTEETAEGKVARNAVADRLLVEGIARYADELLPKMVSAETLQNRPDVAKHVLTMMRDAPAEGAAAALRARAERPDYREVLEHLGVSTPVVVGSEDEFTPVSDAELMQRLVTGSEPAVIRGAGHLPNLERAAEFNDVFGRFLDTLRLRPASGEER